MSETFDTAATVRELTDAGMDRKQAEAVAAACRKAFEAGRAAKNRDLDAAIEDLTKTLAGIRERWARFFD